MFVSNFALNKQFRIFGPNFAQEGYLWSEIQKLNNIIFRLYKVVLVPNFSLNWQFWFFWPDLPRKGFSGLKQKKWTPHIFYIILHIQICLERNFSSNWKVWFFRPNLPKKVFPVENRKTFRKNSSLNSVVKTMTFQAKLPSLYF